MFMGKIVELKQNEISVVSGGVGGSDKDKEGVVNNGLWGSVKELCWIGAKSFIEVAVKLTVYAAVGICVYRNITAPGTFLYTIQNAVGAANMLSNLKGMFGGNQSA